MTKFVPLMMAGLTLAGCSTCKNPDDPILGNWGVRLPYDDMYAGHMILSRTSDGLPQAYVLWRWGSPEWCSEVRFDGDKFSFTHPYGPVFRGVVDGDQMTGEIAEVNKKTKKIGAWKKFCGWRNPEIEPARTDDAKFGAPIDLLENGLADWIGMSQKGTFGWSFKDGVLSNKLGLKPDGSWKGGGINLKTKRADFEDFKIEYDVRVPRGSNSGVYLRGRYEIQVVDSYGKPVDRHNMAAYYGRAVPRVSAELPPDEWQHVSVVLYRRHITVELNGTRIIDNEPVTGVTGGAINANEFVPGPIYLQGDHSDADYKNMFLCPVVE